MSWVLNPILADEYSSTHLVRRCFSPFSLSLFSSLLNSSFPSSLNSDQDLVVLSPSQATFEPHLSLPFRNQSSHPPPPFIPKPMKLSDTMSHHASAVSWSLLDYFELGKSSIFLICG
ncbi:hypothetical protein V6N13_082101 [Hibiscus sabdariffa]